MKNKQEKQKVTATKLPDNWVPERFRVVNRKPTAKEFLLSMWLPTTSKEERELWYKTCDWARDVIQIMEQYKNS